MNTPTPYEIAMIAATLKDVTAQGVKNALKIYQAASKVIKEDTESQLRDEKLSIEEVMNRVDIRSMKGFENLLLWRYEGNEKKVTDYIKRARREDIYAHEVGTLKELKTNKKKEEGRQNQGKAQRKASRKHSGV